MDPAGGIIRRASDGSPEGVLLENAVPLVTHRIARPSDEAIERAIIAFGQDLLSYGVVGVHDPAPVAPTDPLRPLDIYGRMADRGDLPIRVHSCIRSEGVGPAVARGLRSGTVLGADPAGIARMGWLKLFADGTLGSQTAALLSPREGSTDLGVFRTTPEQLAELANRAADGGIATQIHAIGDAAVRAALDALAPTVSRVTFMPRLEHVQLCHPDDRGAEAWGYTYRTFLDAGAVLAFGTDAPVEPIDPWPGIAIAVLRRDPSWGPDAEPFGPHEALTLEEALRANSVAPATTIRDRFGGRLIPGSPGDLIVLPAAPREPEAQAVAFAAVRPRLVLVGGVAAVER